ILQSNEENPIHTIKKKVNLGNQKIPFPTSLSQGNYTARIWLKQKPDQSLSFSFQVLPEENKVSVTEHTLSLPSSPSDISTIRRLLENPLAVINQPFGKKQPIYATLECQDTIGSFWAASQCVEILSLTHPTLAYVGGWRLEDGAYIQGYLEKKHLTMFSSQSEYSIVIDKVDQTLYVYHQDTLLYQMPISSGFMTKDALNKETAAGIYFITEKKLQEKKGATYYDYLLSFTPHAAICQVPYTLSQKKADYTSSITSLGKKSSDGNILVDYRGADTNAYWLWKNIPIYSPILILDDEDQRLQQIRNLYPTNSEKYLFPNMRVQTASLGDLSENQLAPFTTINLSFAGDCVLGGEEKSRKDPLSFDNVVAEKGYTWPFSGVSSLLLNDDMTVVNLEVVLKDDNANMLPNKLHNFRGSTDYVNILTLAGIEQVNVANNHFIDYGNKGRESTIIALESADIAYSGYEHLYISNINGHKIGFGGIRETIYQQNPSLMEQDIVTLKQQGCEAIIYSCHFGKEYQPFHTDLQQKMARKAIDLGADIVIGHHAHVVQGIEGYHGGIIFYGLGNFVFGGNLQLTEFDACMIQTKLLFQDTSYYGTQITLYPVLTSGAIPENDFRPILAQGEDKKRILDKIQADSVFPIEEKMFFPSNIP
ncbi:MAG: L,D-transpeptidase family protein, partial [Clostridiales bacterium]|nr:L,D-transpeptidase family protein [Clostridiales bacterium]